MNSVPARLPTERSFGLGVGAVCTVAGLLGWWRGYSAASVLVVSGILLMTSGLLAPAALRVPNRVWWRFAQALGWINARVVLTAFFFVVITPAGVLMRLCGRDPLRSPAMTGWFPYVARRRDRTHYDHLF